LAHGANAKGKDEYGSTALQYAASKGYFDLMLRLEKLGADIHHIDNFNSNTIYIIYFLNFALEKRQQ